MNPSKSKISALWGEIIKGYSIIKDKVFGELYCKHLTYQNQSEIDYKYDEFLQLAIDKNLPLEKDHLDILISKDLWNKDKDQEIRTLKDYIKNLNDTKEKLVKLSDQNQIKVQINDAEKKLVTLLNEKSELLGWTAEKYATSVISGLYTSFSIFKDSELKIRLFSYENDESDEDDIERVRQAYESRMMNFTDSIMKKIALSPSFLNCFYLCDNNPFTFYGKPTVDLTIYQAGVFIHGCNFKAILTDTEVKPPQDLMDNPDELVEWYNRSKNANKIINKQETNVGIPGLTAKDYADLGIQAEDMSAKLSKAAKKKGGSLDMEELIKLHGINI